MRADGSSLARMSSISKLAWAVVSVAGVMVGACGGPAQVGDECTREGSVEQCEGDAVCDRDASDALVCTARCDDTTDCPASQSCKGVSGTELHACHPDD